MGRRIQVRAVTWFRIALAGLAGVSITVVVASVYGMSAEESWDFASIAALGALIVGAAGSSVMWLLRRRSVRMQLVVVSLSAVATVVVGALVAANEMFLSDHDLKALFVIVSASASVGVVSALVSGMRMASASRAIRDSAAKMNGEPLRFEHLDDAAEEFRSIGRSLEEMSSRLHEAREKERAVDASRRELVAWVSHDLRTPLAGIRAMAEALEDGVVTDADTVERYHRNLREEADRLALLVDDLFELSRINAGGLKLEMAKVSLDELVSEALASMSGVARAKGVKLEGRMTTDSAIVELSAAEMTRVLRNLVENAIRHTPTDGSVSIEAGIDRERAFVRVADACGGIPQTDIDRVFDMAFRGEAERSRDGGGGLGLAIARGIVEAHSGEIRVENQDSGCLFTVTLPLLRA
jgi:signal transduction histidine kinase